MIDRVGRGGNVLALDQGTSGTKAAVIDVAGKVLATAEMPLSPVYGPNGSVEQDPHKLWASVLDAGHAALQRAGVPVGICALANQGETVLAWDRGTGRPLTPAIVWQDRRAATICRELRHLAADVAARTGLVLDPYFSAPKMAWLRGNLTRDGVVTTSDSWLLYKLTGEFVTDVATASRSACFDIDAFVWDEQLLDAFGLSGEPLPRVVDNDTCIGTTAAFGSQMLVAGLSLDQPAALLAQGCLDRGSAKCTFGTGAFLLANTGSSSIRSLRGLTSSVAWRARAMPSYCVDGQVYAAGSVVRWLCRLGLLADPTELDSVAAANAGHVLCVPTLAGSGAPWWRADARASLTGMTLATGPGEVVLAALQGIAAQVADLVDVLRADLGTALDVLRVDGGLTRSRVLMQATADLTGLPLEVFPSEHATALGAAVLGRLATDPSADPADLLRPASDAAIYEPRMPADRVAEFRERWRAVGDTPAATSASVTP